MPTYAIYLRPKSSVAAWLSSDTIFGAICWAIRLLEGSQALTRWLDRCQSETPEWFVSSAFPFFDRNPPLHFLPKPLTLNPDAETVAESAADDKNRLLKAREGAKTISKATFVSENLFAKAVKGELTAKSLLEQVLDGKVIAISDCLMAEEEQPSEMSTRLWTTVDTQHTAVDRVLASAAEGLLYFDTEHFFNTRVGLFFLLRCPDDFPIEPICRFLKHDGLGGNRSVGKGHFDLTAKVVDDWLTKLEGKSHDVGSEKPPSKTLAAVLLSQCVPKEGEFEPEKSLYHLVSKRPKFESAFGQPNRIYKGIVRFIAEGSVLVPKQFKSAFGQLVKVGDQTDFDGVSHPVYHNGIGFALRMVMP
ncbi:MAG: type III-A CRISPR-associated RAMP protein Csm4 [Candidatus Bathyarchaeia archaeon]